jgi:hypothetical protein
MQPPSNLNSKEVDRLLRGGISVTRSESRLGLDVTFSTHGLAWYVNYMDIAGMTGLRLSVDMFKRLLRYEPSDANWRPLQIAAIPLIARGQTAYYQFVWFLDAGPPKAFTSIEPSYDYIPNVLRIPANLPAFRIRNDSSGVLAFNEDEVSLLRKGQTLSMELPTQQSVRDIAPGFSHRA